MNALRLVFPRTLRASIAHRQYANQSNKTAVTTATSKATAESPKPPTNARSSPPSPFDSLGMSLNTPLTGERSSIDALGPTTFTISGVRVHGSVLIMPNYSTLWNIDDWTHVSPPAFTLIKLAHPRPDIVLFGTGASVLPVSKEVISFFSEIQVSLEVLDTKNACHTFNVLNQESRNVAAALIPMGYSHDFGS